MLDLSHLSIVDHPDVTKWQARVTTIERLLLKIDGDAADRLLRERRTLLRRIHGVELAVQLPL